MVNCDHDYCNYHDHDVLNDYVNDCNDHDVLDDYVSDRNDHDVDEYDHDHGDAHDCDHGDDHDGYVLFLHIHRHRNIHVTLIDFLIFISVHYYLLIVVYYIKQIIICEFLQNYHLTNYHQFMKILNIHNFLFHTLILIHLVNQII